MGTIPAILRELEAAVVGGGALSSEQAAEFQQRVLQQIESHTELLAKRDMKGTGAWFRPQELELLRAYLSRAFYARCTVVRPVYNHLVISAAEDDLPGARNFAARLGAAAAEFFQESEADYVRVVSETQFLACCDADLRARLLGSLGACRLILIPDFQAVNLERFETALEALGIGRYSVVLCVSEDVAAELQNYSNRDYRLSRYLLRRTYHYTENTGRDAYAYACRQLEAGGLTLTDAFRAKLEAYVLAVYPEAVLQGADFVRDLLIRIEDTRAEALRFSGTLTAEDVPYSAKAELLEQRQNKPQDAPSENKAEAETPPAPAPEKTPPSPGAGKQDKFTKALPEVRAFGARHGQAARTALLLLYLSDNNKASETIEYKIGARTYQGLLTNDAPVQYLLDCAWEDGVKEVIVLPLLSKEVQDKPEINENRFEKILAAYNRLRNEAFCRADCILLPEAANPLELSASVFKEISRRVEANPNSLIYVDYTGGLRDISMLLVVLTRFFEFSGCQLRKIVYSKLFSRSINEINDIYSVLNMLNATGSFLETGNAKAFLEAFQDQDPADRSSPQQELLNTLQDYSDAMSVCKVSDVQNQILDIRQKLNELKESETVGEVKSEMLKTFVPTIESRLRVNQVLISAENDTLLDYPSLIEWCVNNRLLQQALTLYVEKLPEYYFKRGVFSKPESKNKDDSELLYGDVFDEYYNRIRNHFVNTLTDLFLPSCSQDTNGMPSLSLSRREVLEKLEQGTQTDFAPFRVLAQYVKSCYDDDGTIKDTPVPQLPEYLMNYYFRNNCAVSELIWKLITVPAEVAGSQKGAERNCVHTFIWGDTVAYQDVKVKLRGSNNPEGIGTLAKKALSLQEMAAAGTPGSNGAYLRSIDDKFPLCSKEKTTLLADYLAIKILRNHINHASDSTSDATVWVAIRTLKDVFQMDVSKKDDSQKVCVDYSVCSERLTKAIKDHEFLWKGKAT